MDKRVNITYETLFDMLRNEKNREELQKLDKSFFEDLIQYINDKKELLSQDRDSELFSGLEKEKTIKQLENIKKLVRELYERREKKIVNMALISSRTGSILDDSALLKEEKQLFDSLIEVLNKTRAGVLLKVLKAEKPELKFKQAVKDVKESKVGTAVEPKKKDAKLVRFTHAVPKFLGKELEVYGPFEEEDVASLPEEIADVLIGKGRVEEIDSGE